MKGRTYFLLILCAGFLNLLFFDVVHPQFKERENFFQSGIIKEISWDRNSIVVNGKRYILTPETKIVDQKGNKLTKEEIKINVEVAIDAFSDSKGFLLKRIVIIKDRGI